MRQVFENEGLQLEKLQSLQRAANFDRSMQFTEAKLESNRCRRKLETGMSKGTYKILHLYPRVFNF